MLEQQLQEIAKDSNQTEFNLSAYKSILTDELLKSILIKVNKNLFGLIIDDCTKLTSNILYWIAEYCPRLIYLSTKNMSWKKWSTYGYLWDSIFKELITLHIDGCFNLKYVYITAPKLQNLENIAKVVHAIKFKHWMTLKYKPNPVGLTINGKILDTNSILKTTLGDELEKNRIQNLALDDWGDPKEFIDVITEFVADNKSLTTLSMPNKSVDLKTVNPLLISLTKNKSLTELNLSKNRLHQVFFTEQYCHQNFKKLLLEHPTLQILDLSDNNLGYYDIEAIARIIAIHPGIKKLNLSDNHFGSNEGLLTLVEALKKNQSLIELKLNGSEIRSTRCKTYLSYTNLFSDVSLIPFFNMLRDNKTLESVTIAGYLTDGTVTSIACVLEHNHTLKHLGLNQHYEKREYSSNNPLALELLTYWISYVYMTDKGAIRLAEAIKNNRTLTSISLQNILFKSEGFKALADAIEINRTITTFEMNRLEVLPELSINELLEIRVQETRIQQYVTRNRILLVIPSSSQLQEENPTSLTQVSFFSRRQNVTTLPNLSSLIQVNSSEDLKLIIAYCDNLAKFLGIDEETQAEMKIIDACDDLKKYHEKLCELIYYFKASQVISTMKIAKQNDIRDIAVMLAAETGKTIAHFIPIISGFAGLITAAEQVEHIHHDIDKHREAINVVRWTSGLGMISEERLVRTFARKLTLINQSRILNPEAALVTHSHASFLEKMIEIGKSLTYTGIQKFREFREGQSYTEQQKLALADTLKILDAIATKTITPPTQGTEDERVSQSLQSMLEFMISCEHRNLLLLR